MQAVRWGAEGFGFPEVGGRADACRKSSPMEGWAQGCFGNPDRHPITHGFATRPRIDPSRCLDSLLRFPPPPISFLSASLSRRVTVVNQSSAN